MARQTIGMLHPGNMGAFVAACLQQSGHDVYWVSAERSPATQRRAEVAQLRDAGTLAHLCAICDIIVSVCPPAAAEELARQVLAHHFQGTFVDANAIAPQRAARMAQEMNQAGVNFVDGGIVGGPSWDSGQTWLYLAGARADEIAALFQDGRLATRVLGAEVGQASGLKMCYAAYTKGTTALLCAILAAAQELGVRGALEEQWSRDWPGFAEQTTQRVRRVTAKAWRFEGEMEEIAATFQEAGLPPEFHLAAAQVFRRLASFKEAPASPALETVLDALTQAAPNTCDQ